VRFNSDSSDYSPDFENHSSAAVEASPDPRDGMGFSGNVGLGRYTAIVLSQDRTGS
jgi:1,4-alpha-glucan branching enzyme